MERSGPARQQGKKLRFTLLKLYHLEEAISRKILAKCFPELKLAIQEVQCFPSRINKKKSTSRDNNKTIKYQRQRGL